MTSTMPEWIQELKQREEARSRDEFEREKMRHQKRELKRARLSEFIELTKRRVAENVKGLKTASPEDGRRHLRYREEGSGFFLAGSLPRTTELHLGLDETRTEIRTRVSLGKSRNAYLDIPSGLDENDALYVEFEDERIYQPEEFAKALVCYVAGIPTP